jgi:hypothetical protein
MLKGRGLVVPDPTMVIMGLQSWWGSADPAWMVVRPLLVRFVTLLVVVAVAALGLGALRQRAVDALEGSVDETVRVLDLPGTGAECPLGVARAARCSHASGEAQTVLATVLDQLGHRGYAVLYSDCHGLGTAAAVCAAGAAKTPSWLMHACGCTHMVQITTNSLLTEHKTIDGTEVVVEAVHE